MILDATTPQCIGTHIQGFRAQKPAFNYASTISGLYGNPYNALLGAIQEVPLQKYSGVWQVSFSKKDRKDPQHTSKPSAQPISSLAGPSRRNEDVDAGYNILALVGDILRQINNT